MKKFNPFLAYIPVFGYIYASMNIEQLFEDKKHFIIGSMVCAYGTIFTLGLSFLGVVELINYLW